MTPRQSEVALLVAQGRTNKQIARELGISDKTVKGHVHAVLNKLGIERRGGVGWALA
jgi:two-component system nitrate/nitrite response regulator NarL